MKVPTAEVIVSTQTGFPDEFECRETAYGELELVFLVKNVPTARISMSDTMAGAVAQQIQFYLQNKDEVRRAADVVEARMGAGQGSPAAGPENGAVGKPGK